MAAQGTKDKAEIMPGSGVQVVRPVVVAPTATPPKPPKERRSFHQILETLMGPMGIVFAIAMAIKSSYLWTLHILDYSKLPYPLPDVLNASSGLAIAFSLEIIGVAAGGKAYRMLMERYNVVMKDSLKKEARKATQAQITIEFWINVVFAAFGLTGSSFALIAFATDHHAGANDTLLDEIFIAVALQIAALYIGVFYEPSRPNPLKALSNSVYGSIGGAYTAWGAKLASGTATTSEIRAMQKAMSPMDRSLLDSLITSDGSAETWDSTKIAYFLMDLARWVQDKQQEQFATVQHNITNRLRRNAGNPEFGIIPKEKGRGLVVPADKMFLLFLPDIETAKTNGTLFAHARKIKTIQAPAVLPRNGTSTESNRTNSSTENEETAGNGGKVADEIPTAPALA